MGRNWISKRARKLTPLEAGIRFEAADRKDADKTFGYYRENGIPRDTDVSKVIKQVGDEKKIWRHRGGPNCLKAQGSKMGISEKTIHEARNNPLVFNLDRVLGGIQQNYHNYRSSRAGSTDFPDTIKASVAQSLKHYEDEYVAKAHMIAAASAMALDAAWQAHGIDPPQRAFQIVVGPPTAPAVVTTTEYTELAKEQLAELEMLRKKVADMADESKKPINPPPKHQHPKQHNAGVN